MKIINKSRGQGKTWDLIVEASKWNGTILAFSQPSKVELERKIKDMYYKGHIKNQPIVETIEEIKQRGVIRDFLKKKKFYIDELDLFLNQDLGIKIETATMTGEIENHVTDNASKNIHPLVPEIQDKLVDLIKNINDKTDLQVYKHIERLLEMRNKLLGQIKEEK